jgi:hypothetical protein
MTNIEKHLKEEYGVDRAGAIEMQMCAWCLDPATAFKDELSRLEYRISGMCQRCQDIAFSEEDET